MKQCSSNIMSGGWRCIGAVLQWCSHRIGQSCKWSRAPMYGTVVVELVRGMADAVGDTVAVQLW